MLNQTTRIRKIQHRYELDPDFGDIQPHNAEAYLVSVIPNGPGNETKRYQFITLLPETETTEESYDLLNDVLTEFLDNGDRYTVRDFDQDHVEEYINNSRKAPIISFDPETLSCDQISFLWLVPPKFLMQ